MGGATVDNLAIWRQVEKTPPSMTEKVNFGAFRFTTIDAQYQIMRATELFGPCGIGWGIRNQKYEMLVVDPTDCHYNLLCFTAQLWYRYGDADPTGLRDDNVGVCDIAADIELFENTKNGWKRVSDPMKKVRTDALTKALSWLGFSADVFLGKFDNAKYVQKLQEEERQGQQQAQHTNTGKGAGRPDAERAEQDALDEIQRIAKEINLVGADFGTWLRETYGTTYSRLTREQARAVLKDLQRKETQHLNAQQGATA